ncbi:hypothetical protein JG688_00017317, partial [Phytophthora aleatoria]
LKNAIALLPRFPFCLAFHFTLSFAPNTIALSYSFAFFLCLTCSALFLISAIALTRRLLSSTGTLPLGFYTIDVTNPNGPELDRTHSLGGVFDGVLRQFVALPAHLLPKMPAGTGVTAWNALYGNLLLNPGQTVVFLGMGASFALRSSTLLAGTEDKSKTLLLSFSK